MTSIFGKTETPRNFNTQLTDVKPVTAGTIAAKDRL